MSKIANHSNQEPFFSLATATRWFDGASWVLATSLAIGFVCTVLVIVMGTAKEHHWDLLRERANEKVGEAIGEAAKANKEAAFLKADAEASRAKIAEANRDAAEAKLELQKLKTPRSVPFDAQARITAAAKNFDKIRFDMSAIPGDPEATALVGEIAGPLQEAGWQWIEWNHPGGPMMTVYSVPGLPNFGQGGGTGIDVQVHSDHNDEFLEAATALVAAFNESGLQAKFGEALSAGIPNHNTLHIIVGKKPMQ